MFEVCNIIDISISNLNFEQSYFKNIGFLFDSLQERFSNLNTQNDFNSSNTRKNPFQNSFENHNCFLA